MMMAGAGLLLGVVGSDPVGGAERFTFSIPELRDGLGLIPVIVGLFGLAEVFATLAQKSVRAVFVGLLPGGNTIIASLLSYAIERKVSKSPGRFGHGAIEGVAGPEAANNSASVSSFVPLLTFGIPTNAVVALLLASLMIHNVLPGPQLITKHPELFWGTIASMYIGNAVLLILNLPLVGVWVRLLRIPYSYFFPMILLFCAMGVYTAGNSTFDLYVALGFGVLGFAMRRVGFEPAPLILAFILGPLLEDNLRRTLIVSGGSFSVFLDRPIALGLLVCTALVVLVPLCLPPVKQAIGIAKKAVG
jgi:putative tricarboxylic transport membrane protein